MRQPVVDLRNVSFRRKAKMILMDISWRIESGAHWALLGANGSGKTTLLKIITGYEWPTSGAVCVLGRRFGDCSIAELRTKIGWVSSAVNCRLPQHDTAMEIVLSGLAASIGLYRTFNNAELAAGRYALAAVAAEELADRPFGLLSQGEQQRVLIGRALVRDPELLILDEPCVGLDPAARQHLLRDLAELTGSKSCPGMIYVTHHIEEIRPWITNAVLLKDGSILAAGKTGEIMTSDLLGRVFSCNCRVTCNGEGFAMQITD